MNQPRIDTSPRVSDEIRKTTCYMCACRCGINVHMKDGRVAYIEGNRDHPVNKGVLCAIPGSAATAIMLAAMMLQGVNPGPLLFIMDPSMVYTIFAAMIIANVLMIGAGVGVAQMFSTLMRTPPAILAGFIVILSLIGAYGVRNNIFDVYVCLVFGVIGWAMKRVGFPSAPLVLGVILGPLAERYFLTSIANSRQDYTVFFTRPISATILSLALIFVLWSLWPSVRTRIGRQPAQAKPKER